MRARGPRLVRVTTRDICAVPCSPIWSVIWRSIPKTQPTVAAKDPMRAAVEGLRAIIPSQFYDRTKAGEATALFEPGRESYNPDAGRYLGPAYEHGASARIAALRRVRIPTLIVHGRQDPMPESVALDNQRLLVGSRLVWLDRCGHWPWIEQPEALERALFEFLLPPGR